MKNLLKLRDKKLSFGIDWGPNSVRVVGLRLLGSEFELTHCFLLDLPEPSNAKQIRKLISKRLEKINFHSGTITANVPIEQANIDFKKNKPLNSKLGRFILQESVQIGIPEKYFLNEWQQRLKLAEEHIQFEIENFALPILDSGASKDELKVFLRIGYKRSNLVLVRNRMVIDYIVLDFSLEKLLPESVAKDPLLRNQAFSLLRSAQFNLKRDKWVWQTNYSIDNFNDVLSNIETQLQLFFVSLRNIIQNYREKFDGSISEIQIIEAGGLYPWIKNYLCKQLGISVEDVKPFSRMVKIGPGFNSKKLAEVEPLFAESVALALSGTQRSNKLARTAKRIMLADKNKSFLNSRVRFFSFAATLLILIMYFILSLNVEQKNQHLLALQLQYFDLHQQVRALQNRVRLEPILFDQNGKVELFKTSKRLSQVLRIAAQEIPNGNWITQLQIVPVSQIHEFKKNRGKSDQAGLAIRIDGQAISGNFISDYWSKLNNSGYFSQIILKRPDEQKEFIDSIPYRICAEIISE